MPIVVPTSNRVTGMIAVIRIRNGSERPTLTIVFRTANTFGLGKRPKSEVLCRVIPTGVPMSRTSTMVMPTISHVCP
jgi:hypothetical protein